MARETGWGWKRANLAILLFLLALGSAYGQQNQKQDIPDAPSAVQPPPPTPPAPAPEQAKPEQSQPEPTPAAPANEPPPSSDTNQGATPGSAPPFNVTTVPEGAPKTQTQTPAQEELYRIRRNVNQVIVPVRVTDESGRLVSGLLSTDFSVFENNRKQTLNFFTSDPFALSAAVILDLGMQDVALQKVNQTFSTLEGAFAPFDEVAIYSYSTNVTQLADFTAMGRRLDAVLNSLKNVSGSNDQVPQLGGPMGPQGPSINGVPVDSPVTPVSTPAKHAHVLNDAILRAALDLGKRDKQRRKIIFVISDGREYRSDASYSAVLQVLLSNEVMVYGISVEGSAIPGYNKLQKLRVPGQGYSNILPKYANATGGEVLSEYSKAAIEGVYQQVIGDARNQYTLGYVTPANPSDIRREIEVRVNRPGCKSSNLRPCVDVFAKEGYYPLPAGR